MLCVWVLCLPVCLCIMCVQCFVVGQESASDPLGLELQLVMSCRVLLGMNPGPLGRVEKEEGGVCLGKNVKETLQRLDGLRLSMLLTAGCCVVSPKMEELSRFIIVGMLHPAVCKGGKDRDTSLKSSWIGIS